MTIFLRALCESRHHSCGVSVGQSLLEYFPDLSEPSAVTIAGSTWLRMECGVTLTPTGTSARQVIWVQVRDGWLMQIAGVAVTSAEPLDSLLETMKPME